MTSPDSFFYDDALKRYREALKEIARGEYVERADGYRFKRIARTALDMPQVGEREALCP